MGADTWDVCSAAEPTNTHKLAKCLIGPGRLNNCWALRQVVRLVDASFHDRSCDSSCGCVLLLLGCLAGRRPPPAARPCSREWAGVSMMCLRLCVCLYLHYTSGCTCAHGSPPAAGSHLFRKLPELLFQLSCIRSKERSPVMSERSPAAVLRYRCHR